MTIDKVKVKELIVRKKELDAEQVSLGAKQMAWNKDFNAAVGAENIGWDDLVLRILSDD